MNKSLSALAIASIALLAAAGAKKRIGLQAAFQEGAVHLASLGFFVFLLAVAQEAKAAQHCQQARRAQQRQGVFLHELV